MPTILKITLIFIILPLSIILIIHKAHENEINENLSNIEKVTIGEKLVNVQKLMGNPKFVEQSGKDQIFYYESGDDSYGALQIIFDSSSTVSKLYKPTNNHIQKR